MQEYQAIIEKFGEPFPTEGRRNPRVNPIFFAAAFQQDTQVKYFHDIGWLKMENDRWHSTSSGTIKIAIRDLILRLMRSRHLIQISSRYPTGFYCGILPAMNSYFEIIIKKT